MIKQHHFIIPLPPGMPISKRRCVHCGGEWLVTNLPSDTDPCPGNSPMTVSDLKFAVEDWGMKPDTLYLPQHLVDQWMAWVRSQPQAKNPRSEK